MRWRALAAAYLAGMREAGMAAVAKHFPGHGAVVADSHVALPVDRREFVGFGARYAALSAAHREQAARRHGRPCGISRPSMPCRPACRKRWIGEILRGELGFHGCVFADDLTMAGAAAFGDVIERARLALAQVATSCPFATIGRPCVAVLKHFEPDVGTPASQARLVRMRARGEPPVDLASERPWQRDGSRRSRACRPRPRWC